MVEEADQSYGTVDANGQLLVAQALVYFVEGGAQVLLAVELAATELSVDPDGPAAHVVVRACQLGKGMLLENLHAILDVARVGAHMSYEQTEGVQQSFFLAPIVTRVVEAVHNQL